MMRRGRALAGALALALLGTCGAAALAQQGRPVDYATVEIKTTKLADNMWVLSSVPGMGNMVVLNGADGVLLVDTQNVPLHAKLLAAIRATGATGPIRYVINTHLHGDHTGGNGLFAAEGATIVGQDNVLKRMMLLKDGKPAAPPENWPKITYGDRMHLMFDGEDVEIIHAAPAHTDGDSMVFFHHANVLHVGDLPASIRYNNIGVDDGGTIDGMIADGKLELQLANADTRIVSGHTGPVVSIKEVKVQTDMMQVLRDRIAKLVGEGKTLQQVLDAKPTADFDGPRLGGNVTPEREVTLIYTDLSRRMGKAK